VRFRYSSVKFSVLLGIPHPSTTPNELRGSVLSYRGVAFSAAAKAAGCTNRRPAELGTREVVKPSPLGLSTIICDCCIFINQVCTAVYSVAFQFLIS